MASPTAEASTPVYENTKRSGGVYSNEIWKGTIEITGDITINSPAVVTIMPGTTVRFAAGSDDQAGGGNTPIVDPYFPHDPAIPPSGMSGIAIYGGTLVAVGTPDNKIVFTSSATNPKPGDWHSIQYHKAGSKLSLVYSVIEYAYYGIQINDSADDSYVTLNNDVIRNVVACGICLGIDPAKPVSLTIAENDISLAGHEGVDTHGNKNAIIENNVFHDIWNHIDGDKGAGVVIDGNSSTVRNNRFVGNRLGINVISQDSKPMIYDNTFDGNWADCFGFCP